MPQQNVITVDVFQNNRPHSCDQCYEFHKRCDKKIPVCTQCKKLNKTCTLNRKVKYKSGPFYITSKDYLKNNDSNETKRLVKEPESTLLLVNSDLNLEDKNSFLKTRMLSSDSRLLLLHVFNQLGLSFYNSTYSQKLGLVKLLTKIKPLSSPGDLNPLVRYSSNTLENEMALGIRSYFHYMNPFFPLFSFQDFYLTPRSHFLKVTIARIGLQFLPKTEIRDVIVDNLDRIIMKNIKLSTLRPKLDTIQALIILCLGSLASPLLKYRRVLFYILVGWVHSLGLELLGNRKRLKEIHKALYIIHYVDFFFSGCYDTIFLRPLSLPTKKVDSDSNVNYYLRVSSSVIKGVYFYLHHPERDLKVISSLLQKLYILVINIAAQSKSISDSYYIQILYHFHVLMILNLTLEINPKDLRILDISLLETFRKYGHDNSLMLLQLLEPISGGPFVFMRQNMVLTACKILNTWSSPKLPQIYDVAKQLLQKINCDLLKYYINQDLSILS